MLVLVRLSLFLLCMSILASCASAQKQEGLRERVEQYARALYRSDSARVVSLIEGSKRYEALKTIQGSSFRFSSVELDQILPLDQEDEVLVSFRMEFFSPGSLESQQDLRVYSWKYDEKAKEWFVSEANPFGRPLK